MSQPLAALSDSEKLSLLQACPWRMFRMFSLNTFSRVLETSFLLRSLVREQSLVSGVRLQSRVACYFMSHVAEQPAGNNSFFASEGTM